MKRLLFVTITTISLFLLGCTSVTEKPVTSIVTEIPAPSIVGSYVDNFEQKQLINDTQWLIGSGTPPLTFTYTSVDNESQVIIAENTFNEGEGFNYTGKFSQFNWTEFDSALWYCQIVFDAETEQEAANHPPADPSNPSEEGCASFAWSQLIPE